MFLELHHVGNYTIFPHSIIMNYLTFIKAAWHKNQRNFNFCICIKSQINTIRSSIVNSQNSYCTSECSIFSNHTIRPSAVQIQKSYCTPECSINSKIILYVRVQYSLKLYTLVSKDLAQSKQGVEHSRIQYYLVLTGQIIRWIGKVKSKQVLRIEITNYTNN